MAEHIMLDLETLGNRPGCAILAIGAVHFGPSLPNTSGLGDKFYRVVSTPSCVKHYGLHIDPATERWWAGQSDEARKVLAEAKASQTGLKQAIVEFCAWLNTIGSKRSLHIWGNGAEFDNAILAACFHAVQMEWPIEFWNNRCYRTLKGLPGAPKRPRGLPSHNALQDATDQAVNAVELMRALSFNGQAKLL
jgi:hypothetical protein